MNKFSLRKKLKNTKGITLIALVVTIIILLILAGISITMLTGNNGVLTQGQRAKEETRIAGVEEVVKLYKQGKYIDSATKTTTENVNEMLEDLKKQKLLSEDEIDRENEIITIKRKDGSIAKEIQYGMVTINISKTPKNEKAAGVTLKVESVEGTKIPIIKNPEDEFNFINSLSYDEKKDLIRNMYPKAINEMTKNDENPTNFKTLNDVISDMANNNWLPENSEEAFWNDIEQQGNINGILDMCLGVLCYNEENQEMKGYIVTNPKGEIKDTYVAMENDTYTFIITDIATGEEYKRKVKVENVDSTLLVKPKNVADWEYDVNDDGTLTITKYKGSDTEVIIPNFIGGVKVKKIGADEQSSIWSYDICDDNEIFYIGCGKNSVQKTIKKITISYGIEEINSYAFSGTVGIESISIPSSVTSIGYGAFWHCTGLTNVTIPSSVTSIGENAFRDCTGLTSITIPSSVTSIESSAFSGCTGLTSVTIPSSVTSIEYCAFNGCTGLTSITIPSGVTSIEYCAFEGCTGLTSITIPSSVTSIESHAFSGCTGLTSITIPNSVTEMEGYIFDGISSITVTVPYASGENPPKDWDSDWNSTSTGCEIKIKYQEKKE